VPKGAVPQTARFPWSKFEKPSHSGRDQRGEAADGRGDAALIDDRGIRPARNVEVVAAGHEVGVLDVVGGGEKARGIHHRARAEQDAVAVDQEDAAVGGQAAENFPTAPIRR
jgi:hypothetical protein